MFELWPAERAARIAALNNEAIFMPESFLQETVLPQIGATFVALWVVYFIVYYFVIDQTYLKTNDVFKKRKVSYQLTNMVMNSCFGLGGLYFDLLVRSNELPVEETVQNFDYLVIFSTAQLGYQLWAIPLGIFFVGESVPMILHHFTVVFCSSMSALFTNGFRYWTPFFYGVIEISSVPLAIMNSFKDNPHLIKRYPAMYHKVRMLFAASFLYIRMAMFVPREYQFLRDHFMLYSKSEVLSYKIFMATVTLCSLILLVLQLFWACLIVSGLTRRPVVSESKTQ